MTIRPLTSATILFCFSACGANTTPSPAALGDSFSLRRVYPRHLAITASDSSFIDDRRVFFLADDNPDSTFSMSPGTTLQVTLPWFRKVDRVVVRARGDIKGEVTLRVPPQLKQTSSGEKLGANYLGFTWNQAPGEIRHFEVSVTEDSTLADLEFYVSARDMEDPAQEMLAKQELQAKVPTFPTTESQLRYLGSTEPAAPPQPLDDAATFGRHLANARAAATLLGITPDELTRIETALTLPHEAWRGIDVLPIDDTTLPFGSDDKAVATSKMASNDHSTDVLRLPIHNTTGMLHWGTGFQIKANTESVDDMFGLQDNKRCYPFFGHPELPRKHLMATLHHWRSVPFLMLVGQCMYRPHRVDDHYWATFELHVYRERTLRFVIGPSYVYRYEWDDQDSVTSADMVELEQMQRTMTAKLVHRWDTASPRQN